MRGGDKNEKNKVDVGADVTAVKPKFLNVPGFKTMFGL